MNLDIGPFSTGSTQKVTWVSFGEFHDSIPTKIYFFTDRVRTVRTVFGLVPDFSGQFGWLFGPNWPK